MPLFRTLEREKFLYFGTNELVTETVQFFVLHDRKIGYTGDMKNLASLSIGMVGGYSYGSVFDGAGFLNKTKVSDDGRLAELVARARLDMGIGSRPVILYYAEKLGLAEKLKFLNPPVTTNGLYLGFSRAAGKEALAVTFQTALESLKQSRENREPRQRYRFRKQKGPGSGE